LKNDKVRFAKGVFGGVPGGGRGGGGGGGGGQGPASKIGGFNSRLGIFGLQAGGFYGMNQRPGPLSVPGTPPSGTYMGMPYGGVAPLTGQQIAQNQANYLGQLSTTGLGFRGRMGVMMQGVEGGTGPMNRRDAFREATRQVKDQRRYARGIAPTGIGPGVAAMLASQFAMGKMDFADTGLGGAGKTLASTGSMIAMFNPLMGLGMTLGGGALGAKTGAGGLVAGAGAGAAFGTMLGGPVGAAVGAVLGGIIGGSMGAINKFKLEGKKLKDAAKQRGFEVFGQAAEGFISGGDFSKVKAKADTLRQEAQNLRELGLEGMTRVERNLKLDELKAAGKITSEHYELLKNGVTAYLKGLDSQADSIEKVSGVIEVGFNRKMSTMMSITGKTQQEILNLANEIGVNLFDATLSTTDALTKMGFAMKATAEQVYGAVVDIQQNALASLRSEVLWSDANRQIDQLVQTIGDMGSAAEKDDITKFGLDLVDLFNLQYPNDPYGNLFRATDRIVEESKPGGKLANIGQDLLFGILSGLEGAKVTQKSDTAKLLSSTIAMGFAEEGKEISASELEKRILEMSPEQISGLQTAVADKSIYDLLKITGANRGGEGTADLGEFFTGVGFKTIFAGTMEAALAGFSETERLQYEGLMSAITSKFSDAPSWWDTPPKWWPERVGDTSTPRAKSIGDTASSKVKATLNKHRMMDASIPGKRKVTSSLRNYNLGSLNSDHVTGNAYDLTGQNLGDYAYTVKANGGLAEFHGWGSSRHLHVVPGMDPEGQWFGGYKWGRELAGTTGDSPTPAIPKMMPPASVSGGTYNYSVVVNGASADPNQIADAVINKIQRMERDKKERR